MEAKSLKSWSARVLWILGAGVWLMLMAGAWNRADAAETEPYSFSWLDPEKKIYVLQNRKYTKANRVLISALGGIGWSNPYRNVWSVEPRLAFFLSESFGFEVFYSKLTNSPNTTFKALEASTAGTSLPLLREIRGQMGGLIHWVPWYAKINVFNTILYFDWGFEFGAGQLQAKKLTKPSSATPTDPFTETTENLTALYAGTSQQFFLSQNWSVRLDVLGAFYQASYKRDSEEKAWFSNFQFGAGLGYRL
ncbi:MAG: outer membrane beta-barrel domain-containing protein [Bdellovibrionales bacterium]|nr:outer membrane beta-barrel domain-containing protein [Bdellovibrionales bacterium]